MVSLHDVVMHSSPRALRIELRVLIATDLRIYRESLVEKIGGSGLLVSSAGDAASTLAQLGDASPDVVMLDMAMPGGRELASAINQTNTSVKIVALAVPPRERDVLDCAEAGVIGYALRDASAEELVGIITSAAQGELRCPPLIAGILQRYFAGTAQSDQRRAAESSLTRREREIIPLLDKGLDNKTIARTLGIEVATVKNHVHNILEKLQVHRRGEAAARAGGRVA